MTALSSLLADGGFVMPPLVAGLFVLSFALAWRAQALRRGSLDRARQCVAGLSEPTAAGVMVALEPVRQEWRRYRSVAASVVVLAPLIGLLGTVTGMIETFDSLGSGAMYTQGGGIAAGISQALVSTQTGLAVAIPGALVARLLDRRQARLEAQLDALVPS